MIARFRILLQLFKLHSRLADNLQPFELVHRNYRVTIHPPMRAAIDPSLIEKPMPSSDALLAQLRPSEAQASCWVLMDDSPTIEGNMLQIDFHKENFERQRSTSFEDLFARGDPPITVAFEIVNWLLLTIRSHVRGGRIRPLGIPTDHWWRLDYLTDGEKDLPDDPTLFRQLFSGPRTLHFIGVNQETWSVLPTVPTAFRPPTWDALLLDADALLPDVGPAIVVAFAALESLISSTLSSLANGKLAAELWEWISDRDGDYRKEPSVAERFDVLLKVLGGKSLKETPDLWQAFIHLRDARNSFVHEGRAAIGKRNPTEVSAEQAAILVRRAHEIADWVERILPETQHRRKLQTQTVWRSRVLLMEAQTPESSTDPCSE